MTRLSALSRVACAAAAAVTLALGLTGCAKKVTGVDKNYVVPEGVPSPRTSLVLTPDVQVPVSFYEGPGKPDADDSLLVFPPPDKLSSDHTLAAFGFFYQYDAGVLTGQIFDQTPVSSYQVLRRESGGGYRIAADFEFVPARRWLDTGWEAYGFIDAPPASSYQPLTYLGRGTYDHHVTAESPLTNAAILDPDPIQFMHFDYQALIDQESIRKAASDTVYIPPDSLFEMRWTPVAGAVGYWIQIYQFVGNSEAQLTSSWPSAAYVGSSRDYFVAYLPAPADHFRVGDPGATILSRRPMILHQDYQLRIAAVNANGQVIGAFPGRPMVVPLGTASDGVALWGVFFRGAIVVRPGPPVVSAPQTVADGARAGAGTGTRVVARAPAASSWSLTPNRYSRGALRTHP